MNLSIYCCLDLSHCWSVSVLVWRYNLQLQFWKMYCLKGQNSVLTHCIASYTPAPIRKKGQQGPEAQSALNHIESQSYTYWQRLETFSGLDDGAQDGAGVTVKVIYNSVNNHYLPGLTEYDHSPFLVSYRVQYLKGYLYHSNILIQV